MEKTQSNRKRPSKAEYKDELLKRLENWIKEGDTPLQAIEKLTLRQYDFLVDCNINFDDVFLTIEQQKAVKAITKSKRPTGLQYNKKYPPEKQALYNSIVDHITSIGGIVTQREKINFRDLDFILDNINYKIVLSNPRTPKK